MKWTAYKHYTSAPISWAPRLPVHWQAKRLSDLVTSLQTGPFGSQLHANDYVLDGVPVINPAHLSRGRITPEATSSTRVFDDGSANGMVRPSEWPWVGWEPAVADGFPWSR